MDIVEKVSKLLKDNKKSQKALSVFAGIPAPHLNAMLNRKGRYFDIKHIPKIAKFFNIEESYLLNKEATKTVSLVRVIGTASCGNIDSNYLQEDRTCYYNGDSYKDSLYCIIANGDSMAPEIEDGDEIICDPDIDIQNGDIVHYSIGEESAIKVYIRDDEAHILQFIPYNPTDTFKTKTIRLDDNEVIELKIRKVVAINKLKFNNRASRLRMIGRG